MEPAVSLYDPAVHAKHSPPFAPVNPGLQRHMLETLLPLGESEFAGQDVHVLFREAPTVAENVPALQSTHELATETPDVVEYLPTTQSVHASLPLYDLYFPATHAKHSPPSGPVYPMLQKQEVKNCCAVVAVHVFSGQAVQEAEPSWGLYWPAVHAVHAPPFDPVYPGLHRQAVMDCARRA
jgi:hypothetical protein